jgi:hypothetical protein
VQDGIAGKMEHILNKTKKRSKNYEFEFPQCTLSPLQQGQSKRCRPLRVLWAGTFISDDNAEEWRVSEVSALCGGHLGMCCHYFSVFFLGCDF